MAQAMKYISLLLLVLVPLAGFASKKKKPVKIPVSRWKETKRMQLDSTVLAYTDTLFISFLRKDSFTYRNGNGFLYRGAYTINDDSLVDFGTARYKLALKRPTVLIFNDEKGIYQLEPDLTDTAKIIVLDTGGAALPVQDIEQMVGRWSVYKQTTKEAGETIDNDKAIRSLFITGLTTDGKLGYLYGGKDRLNNPSWYIKTYGTDQLMLCEGRNQRTLKILRCQGGELILEENDETYYFKQFK